MLRRPLSMTRNSIVIRTVAIYDTRINTNMLQHLAEHCPKLAIRPTPLNCFRQRTSIIARQWLRHAMLQCEKRVVDGFALMYHPPLSSEIGCSRSRWIGCGDGWVRSTQTCGDSCVDGLGAAMLAAGHSFNAVCLVRVAWRLSPGQDIVTARVFYCGLSVEGSFPLSHPKEDNIAVCIRRTVSQQDSSIS